MSVKETMSFARAARSAAAISLLFLGFAATPAYAGQLCGNAFLDVNEQCDDGNNVDGDGCTRLCEIENGWQCTNPFVAIDDSGALQDGGFELGPGAAWDNLSGVSPVVCTVDDCALEPASARTGIGWAQLGGIPNKPSLLVQTADLDSNAQYLSFDLDHLNCPGPGANDQFRITLDGKAIFSSGGGDPGCAAGEGYNTKVINLALAPGGPWTGQGGVEFMLQVFTFEGELEVAVDNIRIGKLPGPPVPSICNLDPRVQLFQPFENIEGELKPPEFFQQQQGEVPLFWGTTADGICGTAQNPPGNHTGQPGEAACIDSTFLAPAQRAEDEQQLAASNVETFVCNAPVDLSFWSNTQLQLVVNYQPGQTTSQDFFGVWAEPFPILGPVDSGIASSARLITNDAQGAFGQGPGISYEFDISDLDGQPEVFVCFGYGNENSGYAQVDTVFVRGSECTDDFEEDKILSCDDNCSEYDNPQQIDSDNDGYGNACDADIARNAQAGVASGVRADNAFGNDCLVNFQDLFAFSEAMFSDPTKENWNPDADFTGDNVVNFLDLARFSELFLKEPGPSGVSTTCAPLPGET